MSKSWGLIILMTGLLCMGRRQIPAAVGVDEMKERLSSVEANQNVLREQLRSLEQEHTRDLEEIWQFSQDLQASVDSHQEMLRNIQQCLEDDGHQGNNNPSSRAGPCHPDNYTTIDDDRRAVEEYHGYEELCDRNIEPGWYRFFLHHSNAVIPTTCVAENHCHTDAPTWVDLQGQSLPDVGQEVEARACSHWVENCCNWEAPITVHNCGDYFVYNIHPLSVCDLAFCAEPQN